jgi:peptidyl-prolyl cis-trans isomerase B (cyclophilin B)
MNLLFKNLLLLLFILSVFGCEKKVDRENPITIERQQIEMVTNYGTMILELYDETPLHRDNFVNLAKNNAYDSLLFHRVIKGFMIQAGDPDSRKAQPSDTLGDGDAPYLVKAEFNDSLFHKKGVLAAARDNNPERASSAMQFYIVHGKVFNDSSLLIVEKFIDTRLAITYFKKDFDKNVLLDSIKNSRDMEYLKILKDSILLLAKNEPNFKGYVFPEYQRKIYKTIGGTPHLDQNYTVFGELLEGFDVLDSIASIETGERNRPLEDARILDIKVIE